MTQQEFEASAASKRATPPLRRVSHVVAHLASGAGIALGAVSALAKRRRNNSEGASDGANKRQQEDGQDERRSGRDAEDRTDRKENRQESREARQDENGGDQRARDESVGQEQRNNRNRNDNDNNNNNNNNDEEDTDDDSGGNGRGNAGSGFFDSPLARKTQRRANDFENNRDRDDEPDDDTLIADGDEDSLTVETNSIAFTSGPDGLEVVTRNIEFSAPPTPTPTPFPTLTLPERDRLDVFGDRVIPAPTTSPTTDGAAPPPTTDTGTNVSTGSRPTPSPSTGDTSGGDNTSDFLS